MCVCVFACECMLEREREREINGEHNYVVDDKKHIVFLHIDKKKYFVIIRYLQSSIVVTREAREGGAQANEKGKLV